MALNRRLKSAFESGCFMNSGKKLGRDEGKVRFGGWRVLLL